MYMHTVCVCALFVCMCARCLIHTKCPHCVSPTLCRVAGRNSLNASPTSYRAEMAMVGSTVCCREGDEGVRGARGDPCSRGQCHNSVHCAYTLAISNQDCSWDPLM